MFPNPLSAARVLARFFSLGSVFAVAMASVLTACAKPEPEAPVVRSVKLVTVGQAAHLQTIEYAGVVTARSEAALGFRVAGKLLERPVAPGQAVKKGQLLAQLDASDYRLSAAAAQAQLSAAQTERDLQAADLKRFRELRAQNFISAAELDRRSAALKAAQSRVEQAQAQLAAQGNQTQYTRLVADANAIVTATLAEPGQVVAAGAPVVRLAIDGQRDVSFAVPEQRLAQVHPGQEVQVRAWGDAGAGHQALQKARVREIAASADPATRTFAVKVEILGEPQPPLGTTITVVWPQSASAAPVLRVPGTALWRNAAGRDAVWVFEPENANDPESAGVVREREVTLGAPTAADGKDSGKGHSKGGDWIVTDGLQPGERVVSAGAHVLQAGERVLVFRGDGAASTASSPAEAAGERP